MNQEPLDYPAPSPMRQPRVILSGCHSGPNPSPGLGCARSLRCAYPRAWLVGKDHSPLSSGLHAQVLDDVFLARPWDELDLGVHFDELTSVCSALDAVYISGLDLEVKWLADSAFGRALVPRPEAIDRIRKPEISAAQSLPMRVPDWLSTHVSRVEQQRFCEDAGWDIWVKGIEYDARRSRSWMQIMSSIENLQEVWGDQDFFLQHHISGCEVSFAFAAYRGDLLDVVFMEKQQVTDEGKTWAGTVFECPRAIRATLAAVLKELDWSGGGELECVKDLSGQLWLIDWNPRFPAWVHGATLAGHNLVSALVEAATAVQARPASTISSQFTRIVSEIPVDELGYPLPPAAPDSNAHSGKHPSGMPKLIQMRRISQRLHRLPLRHTDWSLTPTDRYAVDRIVAADALGCATPRRLYLPDLARDSIGRVARRAYDVTKRSGLQVRPAYSIKTNPFSSLVKLARDHGFLAEVIGVDEVRHAKRLGFATDEIIYNGPVPARRVSGEESYRAVFADSLQGLVRLFGEDIARIRGARLRPIGINSRFGIDISDPTEFHAIVDTIKRQPAGTELGFSLHSQSSIIGITRWMRAVEDVIGATHEIERLCRRPISVLDVGGGWTPSGLDVFLDGGLGRLVEITRRELGSVREIVIEPGKGVSERSMCVVASVIEIRSAGVILDASISDIPHAREVARPIIAMSARGHIQRLGDGDTPLLGRLCMEDDLLSEGVVIPDWLREGDRVVFGSCGGYDTSMSYSFGRGALSS